MLSHNQPIQKYLELITWYCLIAWCIVIGWSTALSNILMVLNTFLVLAFVWKSHTWNIFKKIIVYPTVVLFLILTVSILWSSDLHQAIFHLKRYLAFILIPITLYYWLYADFSALIKGLRYLGYSLVLAFSITIIWNIIPTHLGVFLSDTLHFLVQPFPNSNRALFGWYVPFMERIHFSNLLFYCSLYFFFIYFKTQSLKDFILFLILFLGPFILGARASMLGAVICIPFMALYYFSKKSLQVNVYYLGMFILFITAVSYVVVPQIKSRYYQTTYELQAIQDGTYLNKDYKHFATYTRLVSWKTAKDIYFQKPILGYGIGDYLEEFQDTYTNHYPNLIVTYHSQWLLFLGIFGAVGLIFYLGFYLYYWIKFDHTDAVLYIGCFSLYTAIIWFFDAGLLQTKELMAFVLFLSFAECLKKLDISST